MSRMLHIHTNYILSSTHKTYSSVTHISTKSHTHIHTNTHKALWGCCAQLLSRQCCSPLSISAAFLWLVEGRKEGGEGGGGAQGVTEAGCRRKKKEEWWRRTGGHQKIRDMEGQKGQRWQGCKGKERRGRQGRHSIKGQKEWWGRLEGETEKKGKGGQGQVERKGGRSGWRKELRRIGGWVFMQTHTIHFLWSYSSRGESSVAGDWEELPNNNCSTLVCFSLLHRLEIRAVRNLLRHSASV